MTFWRTGLSLCLVVGTGVNAFVPSKWISARLTVDSITQPHQRVPFTFRSTSEPEEDDEPSNPYQDPNYPELEFIDYSDPEYVVDQGVSDEFSPSGVDDTEFEIEAMREDRRKRNDEYQFETYFADFLKNGDEYKGEWTVYKTSTFGKEPHKLDANGYPRFIKARRTLKVVSKGYKVVLDPSAKWRVDGERISHEEKAVPDSESDTYKSWKQDLDTDQGFGRHEPSPSEELNKLSAEAKQTEEEILANKYWPDQLSAFDFRGEQGNMCVGNAYTVCTSVPLVEGGHAHEGPFAELRTEVGIQSKHMRLRIKLDYSVKGAERETTPFPPLHLKSMTVCRETQEMWPRDRSVSETLFGAPGAPGGLYDPPPVGGDEQADCYMLLDLEGGATVLFPYVMDQNPEAFGGHGWVTSLDWTPGSMRYQVDRKVPGGKGLMGLRTLELSEVQGADADTYRPRDGGQDMRQ